VPIPLATATRRTLVFVCTAGGVGVATPGSSGETAVMVPPFLSGIGYMCDTECDER
jgi:hypothetical protein